MNLDLVVGSGDLSATVLELMNWADANGRLYELIHGAHRQNPGNAKLKAFVIGFPGTLAGATPSTATNSENYLAMVMQRLETRGWKRTTLPHAAGITFWAIALREEFVHAGATLRSGNWMPHFFLFSIVSNLTLNDFRNHCAGCADIMMDARRWSTCTPVVVTTGINAEVAREAEKRPRSIRRELMWATIVMPLVCVPEGSQLAYCRDVGLLWINSMKKISQLIPEVFVP